MPFTKHAYVREAYKIYSIVGVCYIPMVTVVALKILALL